MLDRLSPEFRHFAIGLLCAVLTVLAEYVPQLGLHPMVAALLGAVIGYGLLWLTPLVRQYGLGQDQANGTE